MQGLGLPLELAQHVVHAGHVGAGVEHHEQQGGACYLVLPGGSALDEVRVLGQAGNVGVHDQQEPPVGPSAHELLGLGSGLGDCALA